MNVPPKADIMKFLRTDLNNSIWNPRESAAAPAISVAWNIILVYVLYTLCRIEFLLENLSYFRESIADGETWRLFAGSLVFDTPGIMYTNALYILLMLLPLHIKERKGYYRGCKYIFFAINLFAIIINVADSVYFSFTLRRTTTEIFGEFSNEGNLWKICLNEFGRHWYLVFYTALLGWLLWKLYLTPLTNRATIRPLWRYYLVMTVSLIAGGITVVSGIRGGLLNHWWNYLFALIAIYFALLLWPASPDKKRRGLSIAFYVAGLLLLATAPIGGLRHRDIRPIALSNVNAYTKRPTETALVLNTPFTLIRTIGASEFTDPHYFDNKEELNRIFNPLTDPRADSSASAILGGKGKDKNVVIIIIESFGREYIGSMSKEMLGEDYKGYTPFTDSLSNHAMTFRYSFCNGRKSIDGMPSVLAGIPMFIKPFILTPQSLNKVCGIPGHLAHRGYETAFFHGARTGSMGFDAFARSIGFKSYYGREDYVKDRRFNGDKDFDGYWAIWDEPFMQFYAAKMTEMKQPFMTAIFTASSHHPFHIPEKYKEIYPEEGLPIHKCIRYTDNALRQFFNTARKQPWFENTVFVITSDHTNMSDHPEYKTDLGGFCSPIIIYDPSGNIPAGRRDAIAQQIDIMPTILNYVGSSEPYIAYGIDLLDTADDDTWAVNYLNGTYQYVKNGVVLQFDGQHTTGVYSLDDKLMEDNLTGKFREQTAMEQELKAIIQSYMDRMRGDALTAE